VIDEWWIINGSQSGEFCALATQKTAQAWTVDLKAI
jgi:hypothetical protein